MKEKLPLFIIALIINVNTSSLTAQKFEDDYIFDNAVCQAVISLPSNFSKLQQLVQMGADVNCQCEVRQKTKFLTMERVAVTYYDPQVTEQVIRSTLRGNEMVETVYVSPLFMALGREDYGLIQVLVNNGVDLNSYRSQGMSPLEYALHFNQRRMIDFLISLGANPAYMEIGCPINIELAKYVIRKGASPMTIDVSCALNNRFHLEQLLRLLPSYYDKALTRQEVKNLFQKPMLLQLMLKHGVNPNGKIATYDKYGVKKEKTYLMEAIEGNHIEVAHILLNEMTEIDATDGQGYTALFYAVLFEQREFVEKLLEKGANVNQISSNGEETPLVLAIDYNVLSIAEILLEKGADPNLALANKNNLPLKTALKQRNRPAAELLAKYIEKETPLLQYFKKEELFDNVEDVKFALNIGMSTKGGEGILNQAIEKGRDDVVEILIRHKTDVDQVDTLGNTPLYLAFEQKSLQVAYQLIDAGANVNATIPGKFPLLHQAIQMQNLVMVHKLLQNGASATVESPDKLSPLHRAILKKDYEIIKMILRYDAPITCLDMYEAVKTNRMKLVQLLVRHGGKINCTVNEKSLWSQVKKLGLNYELQNYIKALK